MPGGRPKGSKNKRTAEFQDRYDALQRKYKFDPVEFLFLCAANQLPADLDADGNPLPAECLPVTFRAQCAKELLPYRFQKRRETEHKSSDGTPIQLVWQLDGASDFQLPATAAADRSAPEDSEVSG